jgi:hypothetical protein
MDVEEIIKWQAQINQAIYSHTYYDLRPDAVVVPVKAWLAIYNSLPLIDRFASAEEQRPNFLHMRTPIVPSDVVETVVVEGGYQPEL